ncbi:MAG: alpha/beta hydrolase [Thermoproteota archaeon]|nr:alpha/beta hydrolase [Thermoproteota archaeon]
MNTIKPTEPKPEWGPGLSPEMQTVIEKLESFGTPPLPTLPASEARKKPSPADAAMAVIKENNISIPSPQCDISEKDIPVNGGTIHLRIYTPKASMDSFPVIVYYHGGGWVIANLDTYDASARAMSEQAGAIVVSVAYRQAPEFKFPTAHNDSYAAYLWVLENAASIKGNSKKVALVGESAGGNLAAAVSMMARDNNVVMPVYEVLVYPIAGYDMNTESYQKNVKTKPLNKELMKWFFDNYLPDTSTGSDPKISLVKANLKGMPATTIIGAEYDPLQSEGKQLADELKKAGVNVNYKNYDGVTHEFFGMAAIVPEAKEAQALAVEDLKNAFK